jgi:hypothetical protein
MDREPYPEGLKNNGSYGVGSGTLEERGKNRMGGSLLLQKLEFSGTGSYFAPNKNVITVIIYEFGQKKES